MCRKNGLKVKCENDNEKVKVRPDKLHGSGPEPQYLEQLRRANISKSQDAWSQRTQEESQRG